MRLEFILAFILLPALHCAGELPGLYEGPWLDEAERRIEQYRKGDLAVNITRNGHPVPGVHVEVALVRHSFPFGAAVVAERLVDDDTRDGQMYRSMVTGLFNRVVLENDLKWPAWSGEWRPGHHRERTMAGMRWLRDRNIEVRGHCLVWPGWKHLPESLRPVQNDPEALREAIRRHILDVAGAVRGQVVEWDVLNETYWYRDLQGILGRDAMIEWFRIAREADPQAKLFINDARIVAFGGREPEHKDFYYDEVNFLVDGGAPIGGLGFQCHFYDDALTHPEDALAMLDRFAGFGLDLAITEYDYFTQDEDRQARYLHDFMHVMFSHPAVTEFIMWGFWEGHIYRKPCALFREDWTEKPNARMFRELVFGKWWTREAGFTGKDGIFTSRGFLGQYQVRVMSDKGTITREVMLDRDGLVMNVDVSESETLQYGEGK